MASHLTIGATAADPYVHLDERALVLSDGQHTVTFETARLRWIGDTLAILAAEGRATRTQSEHTFGGFEAEGGEFVLYASTAHAALSLRVRRADVESLLQAFPGR